MTTTTPETFTSPATDVGTELRDGYAEVGDVRLHYVEAGDGPLVVLLHGFPESWYGGASRSRRPRSRLRRRRAGPARLRRVGEAGGLRPTPRHAGRRHPRADPGARCGVGEWSVTTGAEWWRGRGDESPGGRRPSRHPQRGASATAQRRLEAPAPALAVLVLLLLPVPEVAGAPCACAGAAVLQALPARRPPVVHGGGARSLRRGVVPAGRVDGDGRLLPRRGAPGVEAEGSSRSRHRPSSSGGSAIATSAASSPSRITRTCPTSTASSASRTRPTGSITTRPSA